MSPPFATREIFFNIDTLSKGVFYLLALVSMALLVFGARRRMARWKQGRADRTRPPRSRLLRHFVKRVLAQRTVRGGGKAGLVHQMLFYGFLGLFLGTLAIALEHVLASLLSRAPGDPVFHKGLYYQIFEIVLDTCGLAVSLATLFFLHRHWAGTERSRERRGDRAVLVSLLAICVTGFLIEAARLVLEKPLAPQVSYVGYLLSSGLRALMGEGEGLALFHRLLWWIHAVLVFAFLLAIPHTKLWHFVAGTVTVSTTKKRLGFMEPVSMEEVEETGKVGVEVLADLRQSQWLQLDACVSCGRCQSACPAFEAGKPLSPRDVVTDLHELSRKTPISQWGETVVTGEHVSAEVLWSCTTCSACVDVCPLKVHPLGLITDMRRSLVAAGEIRGAPSQALQKMQRSGNPWGLPKRERMNWAKGLDVPRVGKTSEYDILYWVGCAASYDRKAQKTARALVTLLHASGTKFAVLGPEERCTGESARRLGDEFVFQELAASNVETLDGHGVRRILVSCPHCLNSLRNDYPDFGGHYDVVHHTQWIDEQLSSGTLKVRSEAASAKSSTYHDPCYLARVHKEVEAPRRVLGQTGDVKEMDRRGKETACCGAGGGRMWFDDAPDQRVGQGRVDEVVACGVSQLAVSCPFCRTMLDDGLKARGAEVEVKDIAEIVVEALETPLEPKE